MADVQEMIARFRQSTAPDVEGNRIRIVPDGTPFSYELPYTEIVKPVVSGDGYSRVDLATLPVAAGLDGVHDIFITAIDERKNESDPLEIADATFDFVPPEAPTDGTIENG